MTLALVHTIQVVRLANAALPFFAALGLVGVAGFGRGVWKAKKAREEKSK